MKKKQLAPIKPRPTILPGFTAIVENSEDGVDLNAHTSSWAIPWEERLRHLMTVGKTGSGKTSRVAHPLILSDIDNPELSLVIIDAQMALVGSVTKYAQAKRGRRSLIVFNPKDPHGVRWNPLHGISTRTQAFDLASTMVASALPVSSGDSVYFRQQATIHLTDLFLAIIRLAPGRSHLGMVHEAITGGPDKLNYIAEQAQSEPLEAFAQELRGGNKNTETTLAEMLNVLIAWQDEDVCAATSDSDFNFEVLERRPTVLVLALPEEAVERLRPLINAFIHRLFECVIRRGQKRGGRLRRPLSLHVDEFASAVGRLPEFSVRANTLRKRGLAIAATIQTSSQLDDVYGPAARSVKAAFNHWVFVPPLAEEDAQYASRESGQTTVDQITSGGAGEVLGVSRFTRPVLLPDEVARPPRHEQLGPRMTFLLADTPPFQGYLQGVWENPTWAEFVKLDEPYKPRPSRRPRGCIPSLAVVLNADDAKEPRISNTVGWSTEHVLNRIEFLKHQWLDMNAAGTAAARFWKDFEDLYRNSPSVVLRFAEELAIRGATLADCYVASVRSNTQNLQALLHYIDFLRLNKKGEAGNNRWKFD